MILYLDTSSLIKLYVVEQGSQEVRLLAGSAATITTSWLAYTEARSALARKYRERGLTEEDYRQALRDLERDWETYVAVEITPGLLRQAGSLTEKRALRALDAIHLASALSVMEQLATADLVFSSLDVRLLASAKAEGLSCT